VRRRSRRSSRNGHWSRRPSQRCLRGRFFRRPFGFRRGFGVRYTLQVILNFFGHIGRNRTRVRFLFGYAKTGQKVNDGFRLDLEFACELIDADLICVAHAS
jgi:hypothetical protein